jgi:hypothetical protein
MTTCFYCIGFMVSCQFPLATAVYAANFANALGIGVLDRAPSQMTHIQHSIFGGIRRKAAQTVYQGDPA